MWECEAQAIREKRERNEREKGNAAYKWHLFTSNPSCPAVPGISEMLEGRKKKRGWRDVANERERSS